MTANNRPNPTTADVALHQTVVDVLAGAYVPSEGGASWEVLHYQTGMTNPRARITMHPQRKLNIIGAIARFVWMVSGSDRLEDIAYYEDKVRGYTDDGLSVPGSSYGKRLFNAAPGLDQINGVVKRLKDNPESRRAAAVVWSPEDAVRPSRDIPCTFGLFFHIRDNGLIMSTVMRSNNAFLLLPFNLFEFSMVGEMVAAAADVPFISYVHWAASMHVYDKAYEISSARIITEGGPGDSVVMPPMPAIDPLGQATELARLEARLRNSSSSAEFEQVRQSAKDNLEPYWMALFNVLAAWVAAKRGEIATSDTLVAALPEYLRRLTGDKIADKFPPGGDARLVGDSLADTADGTLFSDAEMGLSATVEVPTFSGAAAVAAAAEANKGLAFAEFVKVIAAYNERTGNSVPVSKLQPLFDELNREGYALAARSESLSGGSEADRMTMTDTEIKAALTVLT